ncbi:MAG: NADH-quinone oxidoreductase subunit NuoE [Pseudomonadota bacterium]
MSIAPDVETFAFDAAHAALAEAAVAKFPAERKQSAVLPLLHLAQAQHGGWLPKAALDYVADYLEMPRIRVYEVASFYDMFNTEPTAATQIRVCTTTPCWLMGSDAIVEACERALGCKVGENSADGRFYLREFECLGACVNAPMMWIDDDYYEDLTPEKAGEIVEALKAGKTPAPGPQGERKVSMPAGGKTTLLEV